MTEQTYAEKAAKNRYPIQYRLFKGVKGKHGALRLALKKAYVGEDNEKPEGVVFLEMTPTDGPNNYQWQTKKISFALGLTDIGKILMYLSSPNHPEFNNGILNLIHDRGLIDNSSRMKNITTLIVSKPQDSRSFWFNIDQKTNSESSLKVSVPVSIDESIVMRKLLEAAILAILAWD